jgi:hypothetical protein
MVRDFLGMAAGLKFARDESAFGMTLRHPTVSRDILLGLPYIKTKKTSSARRLAQNHRAGLAWAWDPTSVA